MLGLWIDLTSACESSSRLAPLTRSAAIARLCDLTVAQCAPGVAGVGEVRPRASSRVCLLAAWKRRFDQVPARIASKCQTHCRVWIFQGCRVTPAGGSKMLKFFLARIGCTPLAFCGTRLVGVSGKDRHAPDQRMSGCHRFTLDKSGHRTRLRPQRFRDRHAIQLRLGQRGRIRQHRRGC